MALYALNGDASDVLFDTVVSVNDFKAGNISASRITLATKRHHGPAQVACFIDMKLREFMTLLGKTGQLHLIKATPTICVPGLACMTINDFEFESDRPESTAKQNEINPDIDSFLSQLKQVFVPATLAITDTD